MNNNFLINGGMFVVGAVAGSLATWFFLKEKYEAISREEIASVREMYAEKYKEDIPDTNDEAEEEPEEYKTPKAPEKDIREYAKEVQKMGYTDYTNHLRPTTRKAEDMRDRPYIIEPGEYGMVDGYAMFGMNRYEDGVVTDDFDNILSDDDIDERIGLEALDRMMENDADSIYVRNDNMRADYEILRDYSNFEDHK